MATNCYHWDLNETGQCQTCFTHVEVTEAASVHIMLGSDEQKAVLSGRTTIEGYEPTLRDALAVAFGLPVDAIVLIDVRPGKGWEPENVVQFRIGGGKTVLTATVGISKTTVRSPERVEMVDEATVAEDDKPPF